MVKKKKNKKVKAMVQITSKGRALVAAIDSGLCPEIEEGYDISAFEDFWEKYSKSLHENEKREEYIHLWKIAVLSFVVAIITNLIIRLLIP